MAASSAQYGGPMPPPGLDLPSVRSLNWRLLRPVLTQAQPPQLHTPSHSSHRSSSQRDSWRASHTPLALTSALPDGIGKPQQYMVPIFARYRAI